MVVVNTERISAIFVEDADSSIGTVDPLASAWERQAGIQNEGKRMRG